MRRARGRVRPAARRGPIAATGLSLALVLAACVASVAGAAEVTIKSARVVKPDHVRITLSEPLERTDPGNFRFSESRAPDIAIPVREVETGPGSRVTLAVDRTLDPQGSYRLQILEPPLARTVKPSAWVLLFTAVLSAALINNFVFTRFLGLCVFFGVSSKRDTALGMGVTFTGVMIGTGMLSWLLYTFIMKPLELRFLQVLVFIGVVAFVVQLLDTVLKKTHRALHQKFGIYLMLITTNCIILAVPLLNAAADASGLESFALSMGAGAGFALALFLMSCARERMELANVPESFKGLPIAFALTGLFALAFMGFSGLDFFR